MKLKQDRFHRRKAAAKYWDEHSVDEAGGEEVAVEVETPLSVVLQIHLEPAPYASLKRLAKKRGVPVTSMAKKILTEGLDEPHS